MRFWILKLYKIPIIGIQSESQTHTTLIFQPTLISSTIKGLNGACFHVLIIP
ncbi:hypothetical protein E5Q00_03900 [Helicobacter pylori]|nr:hypothetical protein E5Q00_03900 [Helicobacter pylori]